MRCQALFENEFDLCAIVLPMKMIDARQNQRAARAVRWARIALGERQRNWTKPIIGRRKAAEEAADWINEVLGQHRPG